MTARKVYTDMSWHVYAACNNANRPADIRPEWFMPLDYRPVERAVDEETVGRAIALCRTRCPMIARCREQWEFERSPGVWAGAYRRGGTVED